MKLNNNTLCIAEWQSFGVEDIYRAIKPNTEGKARSISTKDNRDISLPLNMTENVELLDKAQKIFSELQNFANQKGNFDDREGNHIFLTPYRNNRLKARNFVGLIQTKSGFCLEILPKIFRTAKDSEGFAIKNCVCSSQKSTHPLTPSAREGGGNKKNAKCAKPSKSC